MSSSLGGLWWWSSNSSTSGSGSGTDSGSKSGSGTKSGTSDTRNSGTGGGTSSSGPISGTGSAGTPSPNPGTGGAGGTSSSGPASATSSATTPTPEAGATSIKCPTKGPFSPTDAGQKVTLSCIPPLLGTRTATCSASGAWVDDDFPNKCKCPATEDGLPSAFVNQKVPSTKECPAPHYGGWLYGSCRLDGSWDRDFSECFNKQAKEAYLRNSLGVAQMTSIGGDRSSIDAWQRELDNFCRAHGCTLG